MSDTIRGAGFLQLNTPASIQFSGKTVFRSDLNRKRSRNETSKLPKSQTVWRKAFKLYEALGDYQPFEQDAFDEKNGEGVANLELNETSTFEPLYKNISSSANAISGMEIVSHHKVTGVSKFIYPDYDGVLSSGVVPQVTKTKEETEHEAQLKKYYVSPSSMSNEEYEALEELQAIWRSRSTGKSAPHGVDAVGHPEKRTLPPFNYHTVLRRGYYTKTSGRTKWRGGTASGGRHSIPFIGLLGECVTSVLCLQRNAYIYFFFFVGVHFKASLFPYFFFW
ncbi:hypothetical protein AGDE_06227 [Angomonas deanei]|uniref:Uncharacterized protein n=1 Tax=Angomonas deanei TaxID=59799 RepID=A0A7G2CCD7_9TRYP|nr:hypothetical protein AGDE_06227 [Angomonas deanei]CAD2217480.1 hypothetical protein, conserved [Angomonas deanei]|eukprot:EPY37707.1 hypothetical protein AGDE_06227 [Angomonas deanei]